jgi:hypothetical protein
VDPESMAALPEDEETLSKVSSQQQEKQEQQGCCDWSHLGCNTARAPSCSRCRHSRMQLAACWCDWIQGVMTPCIMKSVPARRLQCPS